MKKLLVIAFLAVTEIFAQDSGSVFSRWHQNIMDRWNGLSDMHKMILSALGIVAAIWILMRLMSCRSNKCCGCMESCNCNK
jgi:flagellar biogenesis protein FliO